MKIGINGQRILIESPAGPELYTINLIKALAQIDKENEYVIYFDRSPSGSLLNDLFKLHSNFSYKVLKGFLSWTQVSLALETLINPPDIFFTSVHTMPIIRNPKTKTIGMIHGLEYRYSKQYFNLFKRFIISRPEWFVCKFSNLIIVPSTKTKKDILNHKWGISENKIIVVFEGVDSSFYKRSREEVLPIIEKYNIGTDDYLIFISTIQPRKNIPNMIEGYSKVLKENKNLENTKILICGKKGWMYEDSLEAPKKYNIEKNVMFLGRVPDNDLKLLLSGAKGYINPSLEEGFGLPLLEAMSTQIPCIVSNLESFRDIGKDTILYFSPRNSNDIKEKILIVLQDKYDKNYLSRALNIARGLTWESTAIKTLDLFIKTYKNESK